MPIRVDCVTSENVKYNYISFDIYIDKMLHITRCWCLCLSINNKKKINQLKQTLQTTKTTKIPL